MHNRVVGQVTGRPHHLRRLVVLIDHHVTDLLVRVHLRHQMLVQTQHLLRDPLPTALLVCRHEPQRCLVLLGQDRQRSTRVAVTGRLTTRHGVRREQVIHLAFDGGKMLTQPARHLRRLHPLRERRIRIDPDDFARLTRELVVAIHHGAGGHDHASVVRFADVSVDGRVQPVVGDLQRACVVQDRVTLPGARHAPLHEHFNVQFVVPRERPRITPHHLVTDDMAHPTGSLVARLLVVHPHQAGGAVLVGLALRQQRLVHRGRDRVRVSLRQLVQPVPFLRLLRSQGRATNPPAGIRRRPGARLQTELRGRQRRRDDLRTLRHLDLLAGPHVRDRLALILGLFLVRFLNRFLTHRGRQSRLTRLRWGRHLAIVVVGLQRHNRHATQHGGMDRLGTHLLPLATVRLHLEHLVCDLGTTQILRIDTLGAGLERQRGPHHARLKLDGTRADLVDLRPVLRLHPVTELQLHQFMRLIVVRKPLLTVEESFVQPIVATDVEHVVNALLPAGLDFTCRRLPILVHG